MDNKIYDAVVEHMGTENNRLMRSWARAISKAVEKYINDEIVKLKQEIINEAINGNKTHN